MATLLLRLAAPLQSWGSVSKFETRTTDKEPTKSGVIGMLAAALGIKRYEDKKLEELNKLRFGIRVDRSGELLRDFHIAKSLKDSYITNRYYLSDAVFLAALESDDTALLEKLAKAVQNPAFPLFLGRRSCPPTLPLMLKISPLPLVEALKSYPPLTERADGAMRIQYDSEGGYAFAKKQDLPISFDPSYRKYGYRTVKEEIVGKTPSEHDPMSEL